MFQCENHTLSTFHKVRLFGKLTTAHFDFPTLIHLILKLPSTLLVYMSQHETVKTL